MPNVAFQAPTDYGTELEAIGRRRKLAEALQAQAMEPLPTNQMAGGFVVPIHPMQGVAKIAQALMGGLKQRDADNEQKAVAKRYQDDLARVLREGGEASAGTPARFQQPDPQEFSQAADQGNESPAGFNVPAKPGDPLAAATLYMAHPATQQLGMQAIQLDQRRKMMAQILGGGAGGAGGTQQGFAAGIPPQIVGLMTSGDPELVALGKSLLEANKGIAQRPGAPVVNPFTGQVIAQPTPSVGPGVQLNLGQNGPVASPVPGAAEAMGAQAAATAAGTQAGKAPYELGTVNTEGAPTLMTHQQQIEAATGRPMPVPGRPAPPQADPISGRPPAEQAAIRQVMQASAQGQPASVTVPASPAPIPTSAVVAPRGLKLQSQEEGAQEKRFGAERGALLAEKPTATLAFNDAASNLDRLAQQAESLMRHEGIGRITGIPGMIPNVPGLAGADAQAKLDTLKSQAAFTVLQAMRQASKTGGALGQVSDREELMLANNLAALQNSQSTQALKDNLQRIVDWSRGAKGRLQNAYDMTYNEATAAPPAGNSVKGNSGRRVVDW